MLFIVVKVVCIPECGPILRILRLSTHPQKIMAISKFHWKWSIKPLQIPPTYSQVIQIRQVLRSQVQPFSLRPFFLAQDWLGRLSSRKGSYWVRRAAAGDLVPARLLNFEGHRAVLQPFESDEAIAVPAAELKGACRSELRPVRIHIPVESGHLATVKTWGR